MSGFLENGQWHDGWYDTRARGEFVRTTSQFRHWVTADGSSGFPRRSRPLPPVRVAGLSVGAPHAHRARPQGAAGRDLRFRRRTRHDAGLGLQRCASRSPARRRLPAPALYAGRPAVQRPRAGAGAVGQEDAGRSSATSPARSSACSTTPSARMATRRRGPLSRPLRDEIDRVNAYVYDNINNGVYRCGFATEQAAYESGSSGCSPRSTGWRRNSAERPFLVGEQSRPRPTGACSRRWCASMRCMSATSSATATASRTFPNLSRYLRLLYRTPGIRETVDIGHIKRHYYMSHPHINPTRVVPAGPRLAFMEGE